MLKFVAPKWLEVAEMELGVSEIPGPKSNPRVIQYHQSTDLKASLDEVPWCSAFVNWCMERAGQIKTNKANARSWLLWGAKINVPAFGCVVILKRGNDNASGHVGFYIGDNEDKVILLGGNQGDKVSIASFEKSKVLGYRWP